MNISVSACVLCMYLPWYNTLPPAVLYTKGRVPGTVSERVSRSVSLWQVTYNIIQQAREQTAQCMCFSDQGLDGMKPDCLPFCVPAGEVGRSVAPVAGTISFMAVVRRSDRRQLCLADCEAHSETCDGRRVLSSGRVH